MQHTQMKKSIRNKNNVPMAKIFDACRARKEELIEDILGSRKNKYTKAVLLKKNLNRLEYIWKEEICK